MINPTQDYEFDQVWSCDQSWWNIRGDEIELADDYTQEALDQVFTGDNAYLADCEEAFAATVLSVGENTILKVGDICVSSGHGDDKIFLRRKAN